MTMTDVDVRVGIGEADATERPETTAVVRAALKRAVDVSIAFVALLVMLPVMVVLTVMVKRDGGPALFRQRRVGRGGELFAIYKFRSMAVDAEERLRSDPDLYAQYVANDFKLPADEDPRITRLGRFLRASSLDELPQLVNVLRGEMSMVGPRPVVAAELVEYRSRGAEAAYLSARPGVTGLWQTSGRSLVGYDERIEMDVTYLQRSSLRTDVSILVRTVGAVLRHEGAH
jgi:lipopolysaccharide/colanic/teichoic acid biosynthesis glycosyltransferase